MTADELTAEEIMPAAEYALRHYIEGCKNAEKNPDLPICLHCKQYVKSALYSGEGKCGRDVLDKIYDVKCYQTCENFKRGKPGQEQLLICGECKHYCYDSKQECGCCILYGSEGALSTYPLNPYNDASDCESFDDDKTSE